ncbi:MAG: transcriptional repressor LexA [Spirochaetia bacterium]
MKQLTERQKEILSFIKRFIKDHKFPPTMREISDYFEISVKGAHDHVKALEKKQCLHSSANRPRSIEVLEDGTETEDANIHVPLLGNVAAGVPLFAEENFDGVIAVPPQYLSTGRFFALNVKGDSMKNAGILDGDLAIFKHQQTALNGDIIVAMVDDAVTLKRFYKEKHRVKLKAENPAYPPLYTQNIRILGKLTYIMRNYE